MLWAGRAACQEAADGQLGGLATRGLIGLMLNEDAAGSIAQQKPRVPV